jgi:hypothetical protein
MSTRDMVDALIHRAKHLNEFTVTTEIPPNFRFNGVVPFDINIKDGVIQARVWAVEFDEAVQTLDQYLETCK